MQRCIHRTNRDTNQTRMREREGKGNIVPTKCSVKPKNLKHFDNAQT